MSFNFPNNPTEGQVFTPVTGVSYRFVSPTWQMVGSNEGAGAYTGDTPPTYPFPGQFWFDSSNGNLYCWYDDGDSQQWIQVNFGSPADRVIVTPQDYGAKGDGVTDDTAALQAAAASGNDIHVPAGRYLVKDKITIQSGRTWWGMGRTRSVIYVPNTFNMAATGVFACPAVEPGMQLLDLGFEFQQNLTATLRANVVQFPPAIYAAGSPRTILDRVRITAGWNGIDASGNCGGSYFGRLEIGTLNIGVNLGGATDFFHGESWHFWPFGMASAAVNAVYYDGNTTALQCGQVDGLAVDKISVFRSKVVFTPRAVTLIGQNIGILQLDGNGADLVYDGSNLTIGEMYSTKGGTHTTSDITVNSGRCWINWLQRIGSSASPAIKVTGGALQLNGGFINQGATDQQMALISGGTLEMRDVLMSIPGGVRTVPFIEQTGGILRVKNANAAKGVTGPAVKIATDSAEHDISGNSFGDCSIVLPTGAVLGRYGPNRITGTTFTPVLTFATPGDIAYTATAASGRYYWETNGYRFTLRLVISGAITYTTAAGNARITGLPAVNKGIDTLSVNLVRWSKINIDTGYTDVGASVPGNFDYIQLTQHGDNVVTGSITTVHIPSGTTGLEINIDGFIPTI